LRKSYKFKAKIWVYGGAGAWHFVTLPEKTSDEINFLFYEVKRGWNSHPVKVKIKESEWKTSIFFSKELRSFIMPIKADIRKKQNIQENDKIEISFEIGS
jgi:tripartite-type tricarboxylate transporter receptor subunit TctC